MDTSRIHHGYTKEYMMKIAIGSTYFIDTWIFDMHIKVP